MRGMVAVRAQPKVCRGVPGRKLAEVRRAAVCWKEASPWLRASSKAGPQRPAATAALHGGTACMKGVEEHGRRRLRSQWQRRWGGGDLEEYNKSVVNTFHLLRA